MKIKKIRWLWVMFCKNCKILWWIGGIYAILFVLLFGKALNSFLRKYDIIITGILPTILGSFAVYFTVQALKLTRKQANEATIINAWNVLTTPAPGNSGKKEAIETLAKAGKSLYGIDLSSERHDGSVFLWNLNVCGASLWGAKFHDTVLCLAKFHDAYLYKAEFFNVDLTGAEFNCANLQEAEFKGAMLSCTTFEDVKNFDKTIFTDCWVVAEHQTQLPTMPQGWKADFVYENGNPKPRINEKGEQGGVLIEIKPKS